MIRPAADLDLAYRLLCAANLAYGVTEATGRTGTLAMRPPILSSLATIEALSNILGLLPESIHAQQLTGRYGIDAYLYGETRELAILAFRGTLPMRLAGRLTQVLGDWLNNTQTDLIAGEPQGIKGQLHAGYAASLDHLWNAPGGIAGLLSRMTQGVAQGRRLLVTGHSKGGALAQLAALRLAATGIPELTPAGVFTFGAPRAGNSIFAATLDHTFSGKAWRFEYRDDLVPHLPPAEPLWLILRETVSHLLTQTEEKPWSTLTDRFANTPLDGYASAGQLQFIDWDQRLRIDDTPEFSAERWKHLSHTLTTALPDIYRDHLPMRGYGYMDFLEARRR